MSDSLTSVSGHLVHVAKFPMLTFQKASAPTFLTQSQPNITESMIIRGGYRMLLFGDLPNLTKKIGD